MFCTPALGAGGSVVYSISVCSFTHTRAAVNTSGFRAFYPTRAEMSANVLIQSILLKLW